MSVSDWDRKNLSSLVDAINVHLNEPTMPGAVGGRLKQIGERARAASKTAQTSVYLLSGVRAELCEVCRGHALHECNVRNGWSPACAFLSSIQH